MTTERAAAGNRPTLTASGIARLADVGRAAVSNWRRRYADFPAPVGGTAASPQFDAHEVEQWLRQQGKLHQASTEQLAWRHIENYQPAAHIDDVLGICGAYLLVRADRPPAGDDALLTPRQLVSHLQTVDRTAAGLVADIVPQRWTPQLTTLLRAIEQLGQEQDPEVAFEYLHNRYVTSAHSLSGIASTPDAVAEAMLILAGPGAVTFDFTSGTGSILRLAVTRALERGTVTDCYGQEIKPQYVLVTLLRLWFVHRRARQAGHRATPPVVHVGDSLLADAFPDLRADIVVANFPFGIHDWGHDQLAYDPRWVYGLPPRTEPELAWIQHALAHLRPGGTAVVLMPPAAALRPAGRRIRAELVRHGALRAVVALPAGLMPPAGISLHIWVLTNPDPDREPDGRVLFVDTTAAPPDSPLSEVVEEAWQAYLSGRDNEPASAYHQVPAIQVLDDQVDLTPWRYLPRAGQPAADPARTLARIDAFQQLIDRTRDNLPAVRVANATALFRAPQASLADLVRSGGILVRQRAVPRARPTPGSVETTVLTSTDILTGRRASGTAVRSANEEPAPRVQPGDILIPVMGREIVARIATADQVGAELGPGVQLVRVDPAHFDPWFVAGILSHSDNARVAGRASSAGSGTRRIDVRRLAIPVLPLHQQQEYGHAFRQLAEFRAGLHEAAMTGEALARDITDGLTSGTLTAWADD